MVKVPQANPSPDDIGEVLYSTTPLALDEYLASELSRQRSYCDTVIAQGHSYYTSQSDDERKQLSNRHITWHNYAVQCGYLEKALPWASERLKDSPLNQAVYCPDCRTKREDPDQYFCRNCNTPFDAFAAFMAGKQVSPDRLAAYDEKSNEWQQILAEMSRRRSRMALLLNEEKITKKAKAD